MPKTKTPRKPRKKTYKTHTARTSDGAQQWVRGTTPKQKYDTVYSYRITSRPATGRGKDGFKKTVRTSKASWDPFDAYYKTLGRKSKGGGGK